MQAESSSISPELQLPLVSIVVTNFNYEKYLAEAIRSCVTQDYPHIEVIVVDDASHDQSPDIAERVLANIPNTRLIKRLINGGQGMAMLDGFRVSSGDFIVFLDSDDLLFPAFVGTHVYTHLALPWQVAFTSSDLVHIGPTRRIMTGTSGSIRHTFLSTPHWEDFEPRPLRIASNLDQALNRYSANFGRCIHLPADKPGYHWAACSGLCFKRAAVESLAFDEMARHVRISGDFYFTLAHFFNGSAVIDAKLGGYRIHGKNTFSGEVHLDRIDASHRMPDDFFVDILRLFARFITDTQLEHYSHLLGRWHYAAALAALQKYASTINKSGVDSRIFAFAIVDCFDRFAAVVGRDFAIHLVQNLLGVSEEEMRQLGLC
jgi:glycosyltransferase involved in cell wall biosynthesis